MEEYQLVRSLGQGAMGEVYLAQDTLLDRLVAVKFLSGVSPDEWQRERFRTEARAVARLQHPNIVAVHRIGEVQGHPFLVSELIRGNSLDKLSTPVPSEKALGIGMGLARGLAALASVPGLDEARVADAVRAGPWALGRLLRAREDAHDTLLFVDQLEELLTLAAPEEAALVAESLGMLAEGIPGVRLLATVRGDFITRLAALPGLGARLSGALYLLLSLPEAGLREAITEPARARGFAFESEALVDTLVVAGRAEGGLPLLQFALAELEGYVYAKTPPMSVPMLHFWQRKDSYVTTTGNLGPQGYDDLGWTGYLPALSDSAQME
ncbi:protein kinase [Archangium gephyra]|uniref:nSTAND1 domain-containing NTPase n=1 Tax=Archangium gephyra TaxID=48 RepID=UPI0035D4DBAE